MVDFRTLTLQLPIQTPNSVAPELQVFESSLEMLAKRAQPSEHASIDIAVNSKEKPFRTTTHTELILMFNSEVLRVR